MNKNISNQIWNASCNYLVGGVNSPVRAFKNVGGTPIVFTSGKGCYSKDADGKSYLDFLNSWGPLILGHAHPKVIKSIQNQASQGTSFGTITENELKLAEIIVKNVAHIEKIRFVNSGTEAVMTAIRLSRAVTKKNMIIKFNGCYHGHTDAMLVSAGSGLITNKKKTSNSDGLPHSILEDTIVLPLDDENTLEKCFQMYQGQIAAVIIEPLPANSGLLPQRETYLRKIDQLCKKNFSLLIFDEVITGFRLNFAGFSGKYNFTPDLVTYGKIIGGGMPIGAIAGKNQWLSQLAPEGNVYQAGTLSGNPIAMAAGLATLSTLLEENVYSHLKSLSNYLKQRFEEIIEPLFEKLDEKLDFKISLVIEDSVFWLSITKPNTSKVITTIRSFDQIWEKSSEIYKKIFWGLIENNIYTAPSAYEVGFISYPMHKKELDHYVQSLKKVILAQ